jgi:large subunit ribosomal protein L25
MEATLEAVKRVESGKNEARRLRASGKLPAVVYGTQKEGKTPVGMPVSVDPKVVSRILHSEAGVNTLIRLRVDGVESQVLVKEYQLDPVTHALLHADFYQLAMDKELVVTVPIIVKGEPKGVKIQGGMLDFVTREIQVLCLPANIPEHIDIDVTELALHEATRVRDLALDGTWKPVTDGETMLVHIVMPRGDDTATAEAAVAEPEVAKKGKTDKDEEKK